MTSSITRNTQELNLQLGQATEYKEQYDPKLLQAVPRSINRQELPINHDLPFTGCDRWNGYELSWLTPKGKPRIAILRCEVPVTSPNLIESKSFKLYLNSFNQSVFKSIDLVEAHISQDLSRCAGQAVKIKLFTPAEFSQLTLGTLQAESIDELDIEISNYDLNPSVLTTVEGSDVTESLCSDLLKSNCLITNQPDWGSVIIKYQGRPICRQSLLKYLVSFRQHNEFHEQCVERIFCDLMQYCKPQKLTVYARYTRRGGLDINPFRSNFEDIYPEIRLARQ